MIAGFFWFDILILALTLLIAIKGILSGFIKEFLGLLGLIGGVLLASRYANDMSNIIKSYIYDITNSDLAKFVGFISIVLIAWLLCLLAATVLCKLVKMSGLGFLDRLLGFIFSGTKVFLIFAILVYCINKISFLSQNIKPFMQGSSVFMILEDLGAFIMNDKTVKENIQAIEQSLNEQNESK